VEIKIKNEPEIVTLSYSIAASYIVSMSQPTISSAVSVGKITIFLIDIQ